jgi:hypothetical protein
MSAAQFPLAVGAASAGWIEVAPAGHRYTSARLDARQSGLVAHWSFGGYDAGRVTETLASPDGGIGVPIDAEIVTSLAGEVVSIPHGAPVWVLLKPRGPWSVATTDKSAVTVSLAGDGELVPQGRAAQGDMLYSWHGAHATAHGTEYVLLDSDWFAEANGLPLYFRAELRGGGIRTGLTSSYYKTNFPTELVLIQGPAGALSRAWLYPGDGAATIVAPIDCARRAARGSADRWRLVARNPPAGAYAPPTNSCTSAVSVFVGSAPEQARYRARYQWSSVTSAFDFVNFGVAVKPARTSNPAVLPLEVENGASGGSIYCGALGYVPTINGGPAYYTNSANFTVAATVRSQTGHLTGGCALLSFGYAGGVVSGSGRLNFDMGDL